MLVLIVAIGETIYLLLLMKCIINKLVNYPRINAEACSYAPPQFHVNHRD